MNEKQSSRTAEGMAIVRAIETSKPEDERICYDPIASKLVSPAAVFFSKLTINSGIYDRFFATGAIEFIVIRERYIDDFLKKCLSEEFEQVVILGAGFDTRAYRIPQIEAIRVFEVDHPATQGEKLKRLKKVINPIPENVTFVPIDFNTQSLAECLTACNYSKQAKTLFIWQGVSMYLTSEGIDNTLSFIADNSGVGSVVIFDYFYNETLCSMKTKTTKSVAKAIGEKLTFGIDKGQVEKFLSERGFCNIINKDVEDLGKLYLVGKNTGRRVSPGVAIVSAMVKENNRD